MGKTVQVTCDGCGHDLTYRGNSVDYRLVLGSESKPVYPDAGAVTDMMIYPPVKRAYYFCGLSCLDHWRDREHHQTAAWKAARKAWEDEHGTRDPGGRWSSCPTMPKEMCERLGAEFAAAALEAFPLKSRGNGQLGDSK